MKEEKGFFYGVIQLVKYTLIAVAAWFIIGAGWNGIYEWYCREVEHTVPDNDTGERFGNKVFVYWLLSFILESFIFVDSTSPIVFKVIFAINIIFFVITLMGLNYFFKKSI